MEDDAGLIHDRAHAEDGAVRVLKYTQAQLEEAVAAERERWRLRVLGLQAKYDDPACRAALKHAVAYGTQPEA